MIVLRRPEEVDVTWKACTGDDNFSQGKEGRRRGWVSKEVEEKGWWPNLAIDIKERRKGQAQSESPEDEDRYMGRRRRSGSMSSYSFLFFKFFLFCFFPSAFSFFRLIFLHSFFRSPPLLYSFFLQLKK